MSDYFLYIDESGSPGPLTTPKDQPVFAIGGIVIKSSRLDAFVHDFISLKYQFSKPHSSRLSRMEISVAEEKGSSLRKDIRKGGRNTRRRAIGILDKMFALFEKHECRLLCRAYTKKLGMPIKSNALYSSAVQSLCRDFDSYLSKKGNAARGIVVLDSRQASQNSVTSHSIFTQKFGRQCNYPHLAEVPLFGHSENHAGLQVSDWLVSAVITPMVMYKYCQEVDNPHLNPKDRIVYERFACRVKNLQYRYKRYDGDKLKLTGGLVLSDAIGHRSAADLFRDCSPPRSISDLSIEVNPPRTTSTSTHSQSTASGRTRRCL